MNITKAKYEIASWIAIFEVSEPHEAPLFVTINIERLRELVAAADKDWALLIAREGGEACALNYNFTRSALCSRV